MLTVDRKLINYRSVDTQKTVSHHILIARKGHKNVLISHVNLFLYSCATSSLATSNRYSSILAMFYKFLSTHDRFLDVDISQFHVIVDNQIIKEWQVARQIERLNSQRSSPTSSTIFDDAKILLIFFNWLVDEGYSTNVNVAKTTWVANFKRSGLLNYIQQKTKEVIDSKNIVVLDREQRQQRLKSLITNSEIVSLIQAYSDPVYATIFKLSLGTAMRPMELCKFPFIGNGPNKHIMPFSKSSMRKSESKTVEYRLLGKGNKIRDIKIHVNDLKMVDEQYIKPFYFERARLYESRYGKKCPPSILFLNSKGVPITAAMISGRSNDAKKIAILRDPSFRQSVTFYEARHWWPTMYLINFFGKDLLTESADALWAAASQVLMNQMGHSNLETTFRHYIDRARLLVIAHEGVVHELVTEKPLSVEEFIHEFEGSNP